MSNNSLDLALHELGQIFGEVFVLDDHGMLTLEFTGTTCIIEMPRDSLYVYISATIQRLPVNGQEAILRKAMELNLFQLGLPGHFLALDKESSELTLCRTIESSDVPVDGLAAILLAMVQAADEIRARLTQQAVVRTEVVRDSTEGQEMVFFRT